ncbi:MAG TPA: head-tail adaptor protein [Tardiphaga sp.]
MIDAGRLKTRLTLQAPVETPDGQGGVVRDYVTQGVVWVALLPSSARREVSADADGASVGVRIILRSGLALTLQHRFVDGPRIYRIVSLREVDDRRFVDIEGEYRVE